MNTWEYMRFPFRENQGGPNLDALDRLGGSGWELVCYVRDDRYTDEGYLIKSGYFLFKRLKVIA